MKYCPKCKSADIHPYLPGFFNMYECKKCGYIGLFPEIEIDEIESFRKNLNK